MLFLSWGNLYLFGGFFSPNPVASLKSKSSSGAEAPQVHTFSFVVIILQSVFYIIFSFHHLCYNFSGQAYIKDLQTAISHFYRICTRNL